MFRKILIFTLLTTLSGCAAAGTYFRWEDARQLKENMTIKEVTDLMGSPMRVVASGDTIEYIWSYASGNITSIKSRSLAVKFKDGKVINRPPIPDTFVDE